MNSSSSRVQFAHTVDRWQHTNSMHLKYIVVFLFTMEHFERSLNIIYRLSYKIYKISRFYLIFRYFFFIFFSYLITINTAKNLILSKYCVVLKKTLVKSALSLWNSMLYVFIMILRTICLSKDKIKQYFFFFLFVCVQY